MSGESHIPNNYADIGMEREAVAASRVAFGRNELTPPPREAWWWQLLEKFEDATILILIVAATISLAMTAFERFVLGHPSSFIDSLGIFLAIALAVLVAYLSERRSAKAFDLLNKIKDEITIKVVRDGVTEEISIGDVVVGDVVRLTLGDKIPADGVFLDVTGLTIDQSLLTGESVPAEKEPLVDGVIHAASREQRGFRGTMVTDGHGRLLVTAVGDQTEMGRIASSLATETKTATPLQQKLTRLAQQLSVIGVSAATLIFVVMAARAVFFTSGIEGIDLAQEILLAFLVAVTVVVVAVPEGLPMMVTVSLALNMMKMARENCLIRKLVASETIGSATVICSDKTGTLTQNRMAVNWLFMGGSVHTSFRHSREGGNPVDLPPQLVESIAINTQAELNLGNTIGNPTEGALLRFLKDNGHNYSEHREKYHRIKELSHNSQRKMSLVEVDINGKHTAYSKGAPEKILAQCTHILVRGNQTEPLASYQAQINDALKSATEQALRVLAVAVDDTLLALIGISDPIRQEVPHAVEVCHAAGIDVKMITGDAEPTARTIAKQAGIVVGDSDLVWTSEHLAEISDEELGKNIGKLKVLARATPMDKLRLVKALHATGAVVAMTGDGTNDAPALKAADVGLSMGITGTEVAKEASDVVLLDDNFTSIVTGVLWGRTLYRNIQRFLQLQLSVNVVALICAVTGPLVGVPLPFTVVQLLWINIIMDTFAAIALSSEPPRASLMNDKPVPRTASIITTEMLITILICSLWQVGCLFAALFLGWFSHSSYQWGIEHNNAKNVESLTIFFTVFVMFQFWHKFNCRALRAGDSPFALLSKNRPFIAIVGITTLVQIVMVQTGGVVGQIFRTVPLSLTQWVEITLLTATIIPIGYIARWVAQRATAESRHG